MKNRSLWAFLLTIALTTILHGLSYAQNTVQLDQGTVTLNKTKLDGNTIVNRPKDSIQCIGKAVPATRGGIPVTRDVEGSVRQVFIESTGEIAKLFVIVPKSNGSYGRMAINSLITASIPSWSDTLKLFMNFRNGETYLLFFYDPATQTVQARTPLGGELISYGKTDVRQTSLTYAPELSVVWGKTTEQYEPGIPTMWFIWTEDPQSGDISVQMWVPEFDMNFSHGNFGHLKLALRENIFVQKLNETWKDRINTQP